MSITPKNWHMFQHYKKRRPPWIKLHKTLLDDFEFGCLPVASRALAPCIWLLASEYRDGKITASWEVLAFRLRMSITELATALKPLIDAGFFVVDSEVLAERKQVATPETETEGEGEGETEDKTAPNGAASKYAFSGCIIRLSAKHLAQWKEAFVRLDVMGELIARDAWLSSDRATDADRQNWFISTSKYLANRNMEAKAKTGGGNVARDEWNSKTAGII